MFKQLLKCIFCQTCLEKPSDRNRVESRGGFNVLQEINDLTIVVLRRSEYICKRCLGLLKRRQGLKDNLRKLDKEIENLYERAFSAVERGSCQVPRKRLSYQTESRLASPSSSTNNAFASANDQHQRVHSRDERWSPSKLLIKSPFLSPTSSAIQLVTTSTPRSCDLKNMKAKMSQDTINRITQVSPMQPKESSVYVEVVWPSKTKRRELPPELSSIGKMLCRGTYEQVANAAWRCKQLRPHLIQQLLKQVIKECDGLCSSSHPSYLRKTKKDDMKSFSFNAFDEEFADRAPVFRAVLKAGSMRASKGENDVYWTSTVCAAAAICLKNRSPYMTAIQLMIGTILQNSGFMVR